MRARENAERELAEGNLWRAKEILQGSIPNVGYDSSVFEQLGLVLLRMGDLPEAGRFLFLSGLREPAYQHAIGIFLGKHRKNHPRQLFLTFPRQARLAKLSEYPESVRHDLHGLGFPEVLKHDKGSATPLDRPRSEFLMVSACVTVVSTVFALLILGVIKFVEIARWLIHELT